MNNTMTREHTTTRIVYMQCDKTLFVVYEQIMTPIETNMTTKTKWYNG